jgi:hypothetical protein
MKKSGLSILCQSFWIIFRNISEDFEILVVDDGSDDDTAKNPQTFLIR